LPFALPPRWGLASGPKLRFRGPDGAAESNGLGAPNEDGGRGPPKPPPPGRGLENPPGRGGPPGPRSSRARASLTASGRPLNICPLNFWIAASAWARSANSTKANPRGRPVSRSTGSTTCEGGATVPKCARSSASVVVYERLPTNRRTANFRSLLGAHGLRECWECSQGIAGRMVGKTHAGSRIQCANLTRSRPSWQGEAL